ncbi:hypothetical protein BCR43DRAFT_468910 [Syncephalastrum racemosum]|uniref:DUF7721 domain-containing protein n=1 Tax=Syncephalastrum racemosum TaxID=13706 RepID=A0A1X2HN01_SYNRA|nr:hypothetical protein BCR43DRAFT_468910 [Syncephalastrum racemosum]
MSGEAASYQGAVSYSKDEAARYAAQHGEASDEEHGLFSSVLSNLLDRDDDDAPHKKQVDENEANEAAQAHDRVYNQNAGGETNSRDMGTAAAMQAFKMFSGGGGGGSSNELVGMAMGEAMKLFKSQGGGNVNQGEMLQQAAGMAMKLFMTQKAGGGGGSSGGLGAIMGMLGGGSGGSSSGGGMAASLLGKLL